MIPGYNEFPEDVQQVFAGTIANYAFEPVLLEADAVAFLNDKVQIGFSINDEIMNMTVKSNGKFYNVTDVAPMLDRDFYTQWRSSLEAAIKNLGRREYYLTYLKFYHQLSEKYFLNTYATGIIPQQQGYEQMREARTTEEQKFSKTFAAMQQLAYDHPVRKKYNANDSSWVEDMLNLMNENG